LLGTGEAGKTTFLKQIIFITTKDQGDSTDEQRLQAKNFVAMKENILYGIQALAKKAIELGLTNKTKENVRALEALSEVEDLGPGEVEHVKLLWAEEGVKEVCEKKLCSYPACLDYFLDDLDRVTAPDYVMTPDDILRVRQKTTGVQWFDIPAKGKERGWTFVDVGGQQSERRKWIHAFEHVNAVLYLSSLENYHQTLDEDPSTSRFDDDLKLFSEVVTTPFLPSLWIFFQNKRDLFEKKLSAYPLSTYFQEADPDQEKNVDYALGFLREKFAKELPPDKKLSWHVTCALDTTQFQEIYRDLRKYIVTRALGSLGL
jgi:hypothetical protein